MQRGQNLTGSFKFRVGVEPLEYPQQPLGVFHVEAHAVLAHENDGVLKYYRLLSQHWPDPGQCFRALPTKS